MGLFSWFKGGKEEGSSHIMTIEGDVLTYWDHDYEEKVELNELKYAYVQILGEQPYLFLFDVQQRYIQASQPGFMDVYMKLSKRFGFNDELFRKVVKENVEDAKERIWIKKEEENYKILNEELDDFSEGFELLSEPSKFISWDTTYDEILSMDVGTLYQGSFDVMYFKFNNAVRIGRMVINELEFSVDNGRSDMPVQSYFSTVYNSEMNDESYHQLRTLWKEEVGISEQDLEGSGHERDDQKFLNFDLGEIGLSILYTYAVENGYDDGGTSITISNYRDYEELLDDPEYDKNIELSEVVSLEDVYEIEVNYRQNAHVKSKPSVLEEFYPEESVVWLDRKNNKIGFSGEEVALIYDKDEIQSLVIQNVMPARGEGYSSVSLLLKSGQDVRLFYGNENEFDAYAEVLQAKIGLNVDFPEPYYNC